MENKNIIEIKNLSFSYGNARGQGRAGGFAAVSASPPVIQDVSLTIRRGSVTTLLGANGSGKSTLFHLMCRNLNFHTGEIRLNGTDIRGMRLREFAKKVSIVHQSNSITGDVSVETLVGYGRTPHLPFLKRPGKEDEEATLRAMDISGVTEFRKRALSSLSGGQLQRVWIAMALAQDTDLLLLDEPTTWLDVRYQIEILKLIRRLNEAHGITIALILHDINQAIYYSDEIIGLKNGKVAGRGSPDEIITDEFIGDIYGLRLETVRVNKRDFVLQI